jgi:hypothetical protein
MNTKTGFQIINCFQERKLDYKEVRDDACWQSCTFHMGQERRESCLQQRGA